MILQFLDNCSDREAEARARYDLRWKKALGVKLGEAGFDYSTLSKFRTRLILFHKERVVFEEILQQAAAKGLLSQEQVTQIMDSTFTIGAAAVQNNYTLIRTAIRKLLHSLTRKNNFNSQLLTGLKFNYQTLKKPTLDWSNPEEREAHLNDLVADAQLVLAVTARPSSFGGHNANIAGPMTAICASSEAGEDKSGRYAASIVNGVTCGAFGLVASVAVPFVKALPADLVSLLAGLAMIGVLVSSFEMAFASKKFKVGAFFALVIAMSGITVLKISAPFWALVGGVVVSLLVEPKDFE